MEPETPITVTLTFKEWDALLDFADWAIEGKAAREAVDKVDAQIDAFKDKAS